MFVNYQTDDFGLLAKRVVVLNSLWRRKFNYDVCVCELSINNYHLNFIIYIFSETSLKLKLVLINKYYITKQINTTSILTEPKMIIQIFYLCLSLIISVLCYCFGTNYRKCFIKFLLMKFHFVKYFMITQMFFYTCLSFDF